MDDLPTIDELARRLTELGAIQESDWDVFKRLEMMSLSSARKEDAMLLYSRLPQDDPAKLAMQQGLDDLRAWGQERVSSAPSPKAPKLVFVSGAPGSGKSVVMKGVLAKNLGMLECSADDFKERFKQGLSAWIGATTEPTRSNLARSVYIHRLTALPSWEMVDLALDARKDLAVEMLGMGAAEDERTIRRAMARGYEVEVLHVGCSVEASLARAAKRYFDEKKAGKEGRWIGLASAAGKQKAILSAFAQLCELLRGSSAKLSLVDNTEMDLKLVWDSSKEGRPPIEAFASWSADPKLWRPSANPAADLCALSQDEEGRWSVALVERSGEPYQGKWALPGGFVKAALGQGLVSEFAWGAEEAQMAALRRFSEETLCSEQPLRVDFVGKFDDIERDPRNTDSRWVESWVFCAQFERSEVILGGDAARQAKWVSVDDVAHGKVDMAFDHAKLVEASLAKLLSVKNESRPKLR
jgi:ADP-ribose pyrophosphatase YjhB (NUDIX family)